MVFYRISLNGVTVVEEGFGQEPVSDTTGSLEPIFGRGQIIVKNI